MKNYNINEKVKCTTCKKNTVVNEHSIIGEQQAIADYFFEEYGRKVKVILFNCNSCGSTLTHVTDINL